METMGLGSTASTVQNLAKNFHYSQFQLSEIAAKGTNYQLKYLNLFTLIIKLPLNYY